jgi:hypothetical protein
MGRWAQRTRRGGGPTLTTAPSLPVITDAHVSDADAGEMEVTFSGAVDGTMMDPTIFFDDNVGAHATSLVQEDSVTIRYHSPDWEFAIAPGDAYTYLGDAGQAQPGSGTCT